MTIRVGHICDGNSAPRDVDHQLFGIEFEAEAVPNETTVTGFTKVADGSLRNRGAEFVTAPLSFERALNAIERFYNAAEICKFESSIRTSMHVHMDVRNDTYETMGGILSSYLLLEPLLFALCPPEREENIYCIPLYRAPSPLRLAKLGLQEGSRATLSTINKYSALNLRAMATFGTLEFRQAPLWDTREEAKMWLMVLSELVQVGRTLRGGELLDILYAQGVERAIQTALPEMHRVVLEWATDIDDLAGWILSHDVVVNTALFCGSEEQHSETFVWKFPTASIVRGSMRKPEDAQIVPGLYARDLRTIPVVEEVHEWFDREDDGDDFASDDDDDDDYEERDNDDDDEEEGASVGTATQEHVLAPTPMPLAAWGTVTGAFTIHDNNVIWRRA